MRDVPEKGGSSKPRRKASKINNAESRLEKALAQERSIKKAQLRRRRGNSRFDPLVDSTRDSEDEVDHALKDFLGDQ